MFSGIVEGVAEVVNIEKSGTNVIFTLIEDFEEHFYIDQSISHNGVCLTVIEYDNQGTYKVEAIKETLDKTNIGELRVGDKVNLERCVKLNTRMDGHLVQGHVDTTGIVIDKVDGNGSWIFSIEFPTSYENLVIEKGSITINGISLTVVDINANMLKVAIIPYTYNNTNLKEIGKGDRVNLEFDILGKYIVKYLEKTKS